MTRAHICAQESEGRAKSESAKERMNYNTPHSRPIPNRPHPGHLGRREEVGCAPMPGWLLVPDRSSKERSQEEDGQEESEVAERARPMAPLPK